MKVSKNILFHFENKSTATDASSFEHTSKAHNHSRHPKSKTWPKNIGYLSTFSLCFSDISSETFDTPKPLRVMPLHPCLYQQAVRFFFVWDTLIHYIVVGVT